MEYRRTPRPAPPLPLSSISDNQLKAEYERQLVDYYLYSLEHSLTVKNIH